MIVRIFSEGQYRLGEDQHEKLNELDDAVVAAVEAGDEDGYHAAWEELLAFVRSGELVGDDDLETSDFHLPPPDLTFVEAGAEFTGEGLIPEPAA